LKRLKVEWKSKLLDGRLPAFILLLAAFVTRLAGVAVSTYLGAPGMLVLLLIVLSVSMFLLEQSLLNRRAEHVRIWDGMRSGLFAWLVLSSVELLGPSALTGRNGLLMLLMVSMISFILWRRIYPIGMKYFSIQLLANWTVLMAFGGLEMFFHTFAWFRFLMMVVAVAGGVVSLLLVLWILASSRTRTQRMKYSSWLWFSALVTLTALGFPLL